MAGTRGQRPADHGRPHGSARGRFGLLRRPALALVTAAAAALAGAGCAAPLEEPERFNGALSCPDGLSAETDVFAVSCAGQICHSPGETSGGGLDLVSPGVAGRIAGIESPNCSGEILAVPGDPDGSLIVRKLSADPPCGSRMPLIGSVDPDQLACVREFIADLTPGQEGDE